MVRKIPPARQIFSTLYAVNQLVQKKDATPGHNYDRLNTLLHGHFQFDIFSLFQFDYETRRLRLRYISGQPGNLLDMVVFQLGKGAVRWVVDQHRSLFVPHTPHSRQADPQQKIIKSFIGVPIIMNGYLLGALVIGSYTPDHFQKADVWFLEILATLIGALLLKNEWITERIHRAITI